MTEISLCVLHFSWNIFIMNIQIKWSWQYVSFILCNDKVMLQKVITQKLYNYVVYLSETEIHHNTNQSAVDGTMARVCATVLVGAM